MINPQVVKELEQHIEVRAGLNLKHPLSSHINARSSRSSLVAHSQLSRRSGKVRAACSIAGSGTRLRRSRFSFKPVTNASRGSWQSLANSIIISAMIHPIAQVISPMMIGRESEMHTLLQALQAAQQGQGHCILIAGEAGIGKSRMIAELRSRAIAQKFLVWEGHCFEQDISFPYAPWIDMLRDFLAPKSPAEMGELLGPLASEFIKLLPELSLLLPDLRPTPPLDAESEKRRLFETFTRFGAQNAKSQPLLVMLEDLHWSDESSLELLHFCVRRFGALPILIVCTYCSDEISPWLSHYLTELNRDRLVQEIRLEPLARYAVEQIARAILKPELAANADLFELIFSLSEGNPFFVEEILKNIIQAGELDQMHVPHSIQDSVLRRVEQLPESTRQILSLASVIGERFDFGLLQEIAAQDEQSLLRMLKESIAAQLIIEKSADQFAFRHVLTRQAVYATLMLRERRALHQRIGETLEQIVGTQRESSTAQLAYHFYQAGVWQKAMQYSQLAGEQAQAFYAPREAVVHFTHAIEAARQLGIPPLFSLFRDRAQCRDVLGDFDGACLDYEAALDCARNVENRAGEWRTLIDLGFLWQSRYLDRAGEYYHHALELARDLGDASILAQSLNRVGNWHLNCRRPLEALPFHHEALSLFQGLEDRHGMARTWDLLAIVNFRLGDILQGTAFLEKAIPILREVDDRQALVNMLTNLANVAHFETEVLGDLNYLHLARWSEEALQIAHGFNWSHGEVRALIPGAIILGQAGDYTRALEWLSRAHSIMEANPHRESYARLQISSGQLLIGLFALTEARQRLESGFALAQELGAEFFMVAAVTRLVTVSILQNDFSQAGKLLDEWLPAEYPEGGMSIDFRGLWSRRVELDLAQGNPGRALEIVERLCTSAANLEQQGPYAIPYLSHLRARAQAELGHMDDAKAELLGTLSVASRQGQRSILWRLHADLGSVYHTMGRREAAEHEFASARTMIQDLANNIPEGALHENFLRRAMAAIPAAPALTPRQIAKKEFGGLTAREREIVSLVALGKSNREIANELVISETTVERHVANILSKLGFNSRTQIAVWAVEKGLNK